MESFCALASSPNPLRPMLSNSQKIFGMERERGPLCVRLPLCNYPFFLVGPVSPFFQSLVIVQLLL